MRDRLAGQGILVSTGTPEQFAQYLRSELGKWATVVKAAGISLD